ncbi:MAG: CRISPR-associated helicase Cas3' [Gammaproteobacteria bacterium]|nr:CRISPR-associated helicase Cas3' [Rhodocyclaceae bacterium]MBU3908050.1 CRISPR-associated helicase Cas3' [Gammaproteobacteria bacterium]MBU3990339.1 CRISPR-associated helicase Cas3' [Gammaproteobacteria bacterium]MBU4006007.1 CRISPR-associated helicase Cas3' [Gammaproteobacteria bacterium]MBU4022020.1 CRISPR-associated helicase Cas3' [Gammaproteobacteria bacterium]
MDYIAHVRNDKDGWVLHPLDEHLREVARRAGLCAAQLRAGDWATVAGLWHDLGKYAPAFQSMIQRESGYNPEAHIESGPRNHSTAGALHAVQKLGPPGRILAYLIAGHHAGLPDWHGDQNAGAALSVRLTQEEHLDVLPLAEIPADILAPPPPAIPKIPGNRDGVHLWLRMLFSCLVDADFLDTEAFMAPDKAETRQQDVSIAQLLERLDTHMATYASAPRTPVNRVRADVLCQCRDKAVLQPGLFSLTVPTGGGKTLASMAFALNHAKAHGKQRVIYAIPYTSIIEQTATIYRDIFGEAVIEHHSSLDPDRETAKSRLATENWGAPVIVTTNVQLFESLFAAKTSRCRKLHNLIDSVIVLDEAQTLPPELLQPCIDVLNLLAKHYRVTVVLCTATQPALTNVASFGRELRGLDHVREIIDAPQGLFDSLKRVTVELPADFQARETWDEITEKVGVGGTAALAIVNTRSDCRELWQRLNRLEGGAVHLSASMCGAHRAQTIADIRRRLDASEPVRVVSTQLIEAGVDVDFPVVYRALAGLDSIAQAAGRCNREGRRESGRVIVFVPPKGAPPGQLRRAEQTTIGLMAGTLLDPLSPETFERYFRHFYLSEANWDKHDMHGLLVRDAGRMEIQFRTAAEKFRYVDDADSQPILVWWDESRSLIGKLTKDGPERWLMRKLQRYAVNLPRRVVERLVLTDAVREVWPGIFAQNVDTLYHVHLGVVIDNNNDPLVF